MGPKTRQQRDQPQQQQDETPEEERQRRLEHPLPSDASPRNPPGRMELLENAVADNRTSLAVLLRDRRQQQLRDDLAQPGPSGITPAQRQPDIPGLARGGQPQTRGPVR